MRNLIVLSSVNRNSSDLIDENLDIVKGFKCFFDAYDVQEVIEVVEECIASDEEVVVLVDKSLCVDLSKMPKYSKLKWFEV